MGLRAVASGADTRLHNPTAVPWNATTQANDGACSLSIMLRNLLAANKQARPALFLPQPARSDTATVRPHSPCFDLVTCAHKAPTRARAPQVACADGETLFLFGSHDLDPTLVVDLGQY